MIQRQTRRTSIGDGRVRYRVLVTSDDCPPDTYESRIVQSVFLKYLAENQGVLECGFSVFQRLVIKHNGTCWQAEAEAEVDEETT